MTGKEIHTQRNRFFMAFLEKSRKECVKMGLAHEKTSYLQEKANLFEIGSLDNRKYNRYEKIRLRQGCFSPEGLFGCRFSGGAPAGSDIECVR